MINIILDIDMGIKEITAMVGPAEIRALDYWLRRSALRHYCSVKLVLI